MNKLKALRAKIKTLSTKAELSEDETKELESLMVQYDALKVQLDAEEAIAQEEIEEEKKEAVKAKEDAEARQEEIDAEVKKQVDEVKAEAAKNRRLPSNKAPYVAKFSNTWKYDEIDAGEHALMHGILKSANKPVSDDSMKSLAIKIIEGDNSEGELNQPLAAMKWAGMPLDATKANELNQSTLASYGDEWVGVTYSSNLWENIRQDALIAAQVPSVVVPQGSESLIIPLQSTPPTFYTVAQASAQDSNPGPITRTVTTSKMGTAQQTLSVGKLGAATYFTGELEEDSLIPWMAELRRAMVQEGSEVLDSIIIDGDTDLTASTNINDIAGTPVKEAFTLFNGFRKSCLITTSANSRDAGALDVDDYIDTMKLMGIAGRNALMKDKCAFIIDVNTHWATLKLPEILTKDVFSAPTLEGGNLTGLWGYGVNVSANMHRANQDTTYGLKANTAGKLDLDTAANNTKGAILAVRWDQWRLGWKRRMTIETTRVPSADSTEIVALMRVGMSQRDTEGSAISYNVTV